MQESRESPNAKECKSWNQQRTQDFPSDGETRRRGEFENLTRRRVEEFAADEPVPIGEKK
jgi:hypothetical protein